MLAYARFGLAIPCANAYGGIGGRGVAFQRCGRTQVLTSTTGRRGRRPRQRVRYHIQPLGMAHSRLGQIISRLSSSGSFRASLSRYASEGLVCSIRLRKSTLSRPPTNCAGTPAFDDEIRVAQAFKALKNAMLAATTAFVRFRVRGGCRGSCSAVPRAPRNGH